MLVLINQIIVIAPPLTIFVLSLEVIVLEDKVKQ